MSSLNRAVSFALLLVALAAFATASGWSAGQALRAADPVQLAPVEADSIRQAIAKDRADTENWLKTSPTSYLATILRRDFEAKKESWNRPASG